MPTTHDNNLDRCDNCGRFGWHTTDRCPNANDATTWRDLADQLTPQQIAELEYCEREGIPPGLADPQHQLAGARAMVKHNLIQALCADITPPADAVGQVHDWEDWGDGYGRIFCSWTRTIANSTVQALGVQHDDGRIERTIFAEVNDDDGGKTAAQARQIAAMFLDAADELERLQ